MRRVAPILAALVLVGCSSTPARPDPRPAGEIRPQDALDAACQPADPGTVTGPRRSVLCDLAPFLGALDLVIDQWADLGVARVRMTEAGIHAGADRAVAVGKLGAANREIDRLKRQRWWIGAGCLGAGILATTLAAGLLR